MDGSTEGSLSLSPMGDVLDHELYEVLISITDDNVFDDVGRWFSWPSRLPSRSVPFEPRPRDRDPVAKPMAGIRKVAMPADWGGAVLVGVIGAEPVHPAVELDPFGLGVFGAE